MKSHNRPRAAHVVRPLEPGPGIVRVDGAAKRVWYLLRERDRCAATGCRVFALARLGATFAYTVCAPPFMSCECPGWLGHGRCVHTGLILALLQAKKI